MSKYDRVWTIRGTVDVSDDIHLLPGDQLRIVQGANGAHRVIMIKGDRVWETCTDLTEQNGADPIIAGLPIRTSVSLTDGGTYNRAVRTFMKATSPNADTFLRLTGTLKVGETLADVTAWTPRCPTTGREILIVRAIHREGELQQNGTGHGDWD